MQKILKKYRFFLALLGLLAVGFSYLHHPKNHETITVFETSEAEFEEANLEGLTSVQMSFAVLVLGFLFLVVLNAPFDLLLRRLKIEFNRQISEALRSIGFFIRFHQIKIGF